MMIDSTQVTGFQWDDGNLYKSARKHGVDLSKAEQVRMPNLKPTSTSISLRLPVSLLERIKIIANKSDRPYRSLIKFWLSEQVKSQTAAKH
ncbi:MAG: CopG family antitoxin [Gammaproteobacteria bacterium]|nr:CopG family antitoxin [Gammaproteobacteria bacterium]